MFNNIETAGRTDAEPLTQKELESCTLFCTQLQRVLDAVKNARTVGEFKAIDGLIEQIEQEHFTPEG